MSVLVGKGQPPSPSPPDAGGPPKRVSNAEEELCRQSSKSSVSSASCSEDGKEESKEFVISPIVPLREQIEKDKDDESLRRWKEQLLGSIVLDPVEADGVEAEVKVLNFSISAQGRPDMVISLPLPATNTKSHLFTLKEGSTYNIKLTFTVRRNIVSGLKYIHTVWKNGFRVDNTKVMLGTFGPQAEPYTCVMEEETTPSGFLARGSYTSRTRLLDDDGRIHLDIQHTFDIRKDWSK